MRAHRALYPAAESAAGRASDPETVQSAYDAARDLQEAVRAAAPVSAPCRRLLAGLSRYAAGRVLQMEGVDRPSPSDVARGRARADHARAALAPAAATCRGTGAGPRAVRLAIAPAAGEASFGPVVARAPRGADIAELLVDGRTVARVAVAGGRARFVPAVVPGRHDLRVAFTGGGRPLGAAQAAGAWLLGPTARAAVPGSSGEAALERALARALAGGPAYRAAWIQDLASGAVAGVNADAAFPAASTVKLGLMAGAIARLGADPGRSAFGDDLRAIAGWSSNLATNRILRRLGGVATAADGLRRLGARASTFPGEYIVGTELHVAPPTVSRRVTTARDLARMLYAIHAAAVGAPGARAQTGLTARQSGQLLGWLLASQQRGDNAGLFGGDDPIAQKNGWISDARLGAAIVYAPRGPFIVVLATYDDAGVSLRGAQALGRRIRDVAARRAG